jgi:hypothetical protein
LLIIAKAVGSKAQASKANELAGKLQQATTESAKAALTRDAEGKQGLRVSKKAPPLQPNPPDSQAEASTEDRERATSDVPKETTSFEELVAAWKRMGGPRLWRYAPFATRTPFIDRLRRAHCAAKGDTVGFIEEIFSGRKQVYARQLYQFAKTKGISKEPLRRHLRALGYRCKKCGPETGAPWAYINKNSEWKEQLKIIKDSELQASLAAEQDVDSDALDNFEIGKPHPYYDI